MRSGSTAVEVAPAAEAEDDFDEEVPVADEPCLASLCDRLPLDFFAEEAVDFVVDFSVTESEILG